MFPSKTSFLSLGNANQLARKETYLPSTVGSVVASNGGDNFMHNVWMCVNCIKLMLPLT